MRKISSIQSQLSEWYRFWGQANLSSSRGIVVVLVLAGIVRSFLLLLVYPPGHGSDSLVYFLYAERLAGENFPELAQLVPPLYPWLILIAHKWLNSAYWLIGAQVIMTVAIAPIYYLALRKIRPVLAILGSLVILGDIQTAIVANFTHTEPVYIFLLALLVYSLTAVYELKDNPDSSTLTTFLSITGALVGVLFFTRPVAKFLIVPVLVLVWFVLQRARPLTVVLSGFAAVLVVQVAVSLVIVGQVEGFMSGFYMAFRPTVEVEKALVESEESSFLLNCNDRAENCLAHELEEQTGQETNAGTVLQLRAVWTRVEEYLLSNYRQEYFNQVVDDLIEFMALSGQQYGFDPQLPSQAQCANPRQTQDITVEWFDARHFRWALPYNDDILSTMRNIVPEWEAAMCPPLPHVSALRPLVDWAMQRYRSLARPRSQMVFWYIGPLVLALVIPRQRHLIPLILTMLVLMFYHALVSAVSLNVQPRYTVVTNTFRAVLIVAMGYLVITLISIIVHRFWLAHRKSEKS